MSRDFGNLNIFLSFARRNAVSVRIEYWESDDTMSVEVISASKDEEYGEKRILDADSFIEHWREFLINKGFQPEEKDKN